MTYTEWLEHIQPQTTKKGARLDLRLYVYPDGHGNITIQQKGGLNQPVNSFDEARRIFEDLWRKASSAKQADESRAQQTTDAETKGETLDNLLKRITPENLHAEISGGDPAGNEAW